jgi:hypothetical protein
VREIGGVCAALPKKIAIDELLERIEGSAVRTLDPDAEKK